MNQLHDRLLERAERGDVRGGGNVFEAATAAHRQEPQRATTGDVSEIKVEPIGSPIQPRRRALAAIAAAIVVLGGVGIAQIMNRATGPSSSNSAPLPNGPDMWGSFPSPPLSTRSQFLAVATDTGLLVWGGYNDSAGSLSDGAYWDDIAQTWTQVPTSPLDQTRGDAVGVWTGSEVVVLNGTNGVKAAAFDPKSLTWRSLPSPDNVAAAYNADTRLYFIDDMVVFAHIHDVNGSGPGGVDLFDLSTSTWRPSTGIPSDFAAHEIRLTASPDNLYALVTPLGSCDGAQSVMAYDPALDTWAELATDTSFSNWRPGIFAWAGDRLLLAGGADCPSQAAVQYSMALSPAGVWSVATASPPALEVASGLRYPDAEWTGELLVMTLTDGRSVTYDPSSDFWHSGPTPGARFNETPTTWLNDRIVLIFPGIFSEDDDRQSACCRSHNNSYAYIPPSAPVPSDMAVPGMAASSSSESTVESRAAAPVVLAALTQAGWIVEPQENATRSSNNGSSVQWSYFSDTPRRRLFVTIGPSNQLESFAGRRALQASRNSAGDLVLVWPDELGATTVALDTGASTIVVRSEAVDVATGTARSVAELIALAEGVATVLPESEVATTDSVPADGASVPTDSIQPSVATLPVGSIPEEGDEASAVSISPTNAGSIPEDDAAPSNDSVVPPSATGD